MSEKSVNYTYMLRCRDGTFYTGWTNDLRHRLTTHRSGKGAKYTRARLPVELVWFETADTKEEAMSREWHVKRLSRSQKQKLADSINKDTQAVIKELNESCTVSLQ